MTKKVLKVREITVPADLAEKIDTAAGRPAGTIRNLLADHGKLQRIERELLTITMGYELRKMLETKDLPTSKPMTLARFSEVSFAMLFAYVVGTYKFDEEGYLQVGGLRDIVYVEDLRKSQLVELRSGVQLPPDVLITLLQGMTKPDTLKGIWRDMTGSLPIKRGRIKTGDALSYAETILVSADKFEAAFVDPTAQ